MNLNSYEGAHDKKEKEKEKIVLLYLRNNQGKKTIFLKVKNIPTSSVYSKLINALHVFTQKLLVLNDALLIYIYSF